MQEPETNVTQQAESSIVTVIEEDSTVNKQREELAKQIRQHKLPEIEKGLSKGWLLLVVFLILLFILPWILLILYRYKKNKTMRVMAAQKDAKE